jgi:hypothetical protein
VATGPAPNVEHTLTGLEAERGDEVVDLLLCSFGERHYPAGIRSPVRLPEMSGDRVKPVAPRRPRHVTHAIETRSGATRVAAVYRNRTSGSFTRATRKMHSVSKGHWSYVGVSLRRGNMDAVFGGFFLCVELHDDGPVVWLQGEFDCATAPQLEGSLRELGGAHTVTIDFYHPDSAAPPRSCGASRSSAQGLTSATGYRRNRGTGPLR